MGPPVFVASSTIAYRPAPCRKAHAANVATRSASLRRTFSLVARAPRNLNDGNARDSIDDDKNEGPPRLRELRVERDVRVEQPRNRTAGLRAVRGLLKRVRARARTLDPRLQPALGDRPRVA